MPYATVLAADFMESAYLLNDSCTTIAQKKHHLPVLVRSSSNAKADGAASSAEHATLQSVREKYMTVLECRRNRQGNATANEQSEFAGWVSFSLDYFSNVCVFWQE